MKKLFVAVVLMVLSVHHAFSLDLNITLANAGDLINQVDMSKLDEVESLTIAGDLNGTDILVIRKMVNLKTLDMENANIVNGGSSYYEDYITSENEIGVYFFKDKAQLERIILPTTLKVVCGYAFDESRIRTITIPKSVTVIADNAFCNCDSLSEVILEDGDELLYIGDNNYRKLTTLYLGRNLSYKIGGSFSLIETLEHLTIGAKVTQIMPSTFENCHNLKDFVFPNTIEEIGELAFRACSSIQTVSIPKSTKNIGAGAFADCSNLTSFIIEDSNEALEITSAYVMPASTKILQLTALSDSPIRTLYLGRNLEFPNSFYSAFFQMDSLSVVNIGNCVTNINGSLFLNCRNLETVNLTDNVISIGGSSFGGCSSLKFIDIPNSTTVIGSRAFWNCSSLTTITIPLGVDRIEELTFYGCYSLESVSIPNSVKSIGSSSFEGCKQLTSVEIPNGLTTIESYAFDGCGLKSLLLPKSLTSIGNSAFQDCDMLNEIHSLNPTPPQIYENTFDETTEKNATLYVPNGCKNIYWLHPYWENFVNMEETEIHEDITEKKADAITKYNEGIALYNNFTEFDSNVRSAYDQLESQQNYNRKLGDEIEWEISELKGKVEASDFDAENKAYFLNVLDSVDNAKYGYVKWTYEYGYDYLISELNNAKKDFESYAERLEGYKSSIESATTNAELDAIIEQMGIDNSNVGKVYRSYWETDYNSLLQFIDSCKGYESELLKLLQRLKGLKAEFNNIASGIETIASTDSNIIVYTLNGERLTIKASQVKSLPKGIYIINGKKYNVK